MRETMISLNTGETTRVIDSGGARPTLVLVHGLANSAEIWERVTARLAERFRVIAFDLPGFGQASRPDAAYDGPFFARQLRALLDALGLDRAILVGSSLGASVVVHFAGLAPERIERAVLAAPGGFGRRTNLLMRAPALPVIGGWLGRPTPANNWMTLRLALHDRRHMTPELIALTDRYAALPGSARAFVRTLQAGVSLRGSRDCARIQALAADFARPALVVWGRQDRVFPAAQAERAVALLPQASLAMIDACGHYPRWEQPDALATAIEEFCG